MWRVGALSARQREDDGGVEKGGLTGQFPLAPEGLTTCWFPAETSHLPTQAATRWSPAGIKQLIVILPGRQPSAPTCQRHFLPYPFFPHPRFFMFYLQLKKGRFG